MENVLAATRVQVELGEFYVGHNVEPPVAKFFCGVDTGVGLVSSQTPASLPHCLLYELHGLEIESVRLCDHRWAKRVTVAGRGALTGSPPSIPPAEGSLPIHSSHRVGLNIG